MNPISNYEITRRSEDFATKSNGQPVPLEAEHAHEV